MDSRNTNVIIPPAGGFDRTQIALFANTGLMAFGLLTLALAAAAGVKLIYLFMFGSDKLDVSLLSLFSQVIALLLLFLLAWGSGLVSIKIFNNRIYPWILRIAGFFVSLGMVVIYAWGIIKCYNERDLGLWKYAIVLFAGYIVLVAFSVLCKRSDLFFMAIPLAATLVGHIFLLAFHYVFWGATNSEFVFTDLSLMAIVAILLGMMVALAGPPDFLQRPAQTPPAPTP